MLLLTAIALVGTACAVITGTRSLLGRDDEAVTTSIRDADPKPSAVDGFALDRRLYRPLLAAPRTRGGALLLKPGVYAATVRSYCLHAGTHAPSSGDGYLYAPLKGSRAGIIRSILSRSSAHPEIRQEDVQILIWNVLLRTKPDTYSPDQQAAARKLLSSQELLDLEGGALGVIPEAALDRTLAAAPAALQGPLRAANDLRALFARGGATYEEIERIAVLPPSGAKSAIPAGQWSRHPGGFFVRYLPEGYRRTRVEVLVLGAPSPPGARAAPMGAGAVLARAAPDAGRGDDGGGVEYDPGGDVVTPANTSSQRLGISGMPAVPVGEADFPWAEKAKEGDVGGHRCADTWAIFVHQLTGYTQRCDVEVCVPYSNFRGPISKETANEQTAIAGTAAGQSIQAALNADLIIDVCENWKMSFRGFLAASIPGSTVSSVGTTK